MENPGALYHPAGGLKHRSASYYVGVVFVGALHVAAIWAFMNAFAPKIGEKGNIVFELFPVKNDEVEKPTPPPVPKVAPSEFAKPVSPSVPAPVFTVETEQSTAIGVTADNTEQVASLTSMPTSMVAGTHSAPPYPANARRLGQEGSVKLKIAISAQGKITHIDIMQSSGVAELDRAAADWVFAHWRYNPAIRGGVAVESTTMASVTFNLKNAR